MCLIKINVLFFSKSSQHYNSKAFSDLEVFEPHLGEIVAAQYSGDERWYRARVVELSEKCVQVSSTHLSLGVQVCYLLLLFLFSKVFFVDFGNVEMVSPREIRSILQKFMHCPFQAFECCLSNLVCTKSPVKPCESK